MADTKPGDGNVEKLRKWATSGAGAAHFAWGTDGSFGRCRAFYKGKMPDHMIDGWCAKLFHEATGDWPGEHHGEGKS